MLLKGLYGMVRDAGYEIEIADHSADAVQRVLKSAYKALIMDSEPFGLSLDNAVSIVKSIRPDMPVVIIGEAPYSADVVSVKEPIDLEDFKRAIHEIENMAVSKH